MLVKTHHQMILDAFIREAGFEGTWEDLSDDAKKMVEHATKELARVYSAKAAAESQMSRLQYPDTTGS